MDKDLRFDSQTSLYNYLMPVLRARIDELKRLNLNNIKEIDVWDYCKNKKWLNKKELDVYTMVNDILNIDEIELELFIKNRG